MQFPLPQNFYDNYENREAAKVQDMTIAETMILGYDLKMLPHNTTQESIKRMNPAQQAVFNVYYDAIRE